MNLGKLIMGLGGILGGVNAISEALTGPSETVLTKGLSKATFPKSDMKVTTHKVGNIEDRIRHIVSMIQKGREHPEVRRVAVQIVSRKCGKEWCVPEKNWNAEVVAIFNAVREQVRYVRDTYNKDLYQHPKRTLQFGGGDCDDYSITLASLLQAIGYEVRLRVIRTVDSDDWNHIYILVGLPPKGVKRWVPLDGSMDKPAGWEAPKNMVAAKRDFPVP